MFRYSGKIFIGILAITVLVLLLAACSKSTPSIDLSQNDPFDAAPETTSSEPSSDTESDTESDLSNTEESEIFTEDSTSADSTEETTAESVETLPPEVYELTFLYAPNPDGSTCTVTTVLAAPDELAIPETIDGYTVTALAKGSFTFAKNITKLTIPATVKSVGESVFSLCNYLGEVHISSIDKWLEIDFANASANPLSKARRLFVNGDPVTVVIVPDGTKVLKPYTFYNCSTISKLHLPSSIEKIDQNAFYNSGIDDVYVPEMADWFEIEFASANANPLSYARNLYVGDQRVSDVVVPESITKINPFCFGGFGRIGSIEIHEDVKSIGMSAFLGCGALKNVIIRDVGAWCMIDFANESANPLSVAKRLSFNDGTNVYPLSALEIPATVTAISPYVFCGCNNIVAVTFAEGSALTKIGASAFKDCTNLSTIYIPETVTVIESLAFSMCPNISSYFEFDGANYLGSFSNPCHALMSLKKEDGQESSNITSFIVPDTTKIIYQAAFAYAPKLESVTIPDSVVYIGSSAFYNCPALKTVSLGNGINEIGSSVFCNCTSLTSVIIPDSVTTIARSAFAGCTGLSSLTLSKNLTLIDQYAFRNCEKLTSITIPAKVNYIGSGVMSGCKALSGVTFENRNNWYAGEVKITASDIQSPSIAAYFLTSDYVLKIWTKK